MSIEKQTNPLYERPPDIEKTIKDVYGMINEIDRAGESFRTVPIKDYIERSLENNDIKPTRVGYLEKEVTRLYADFLLSQQRARELDNLRERNFSKRDFFRIFFPGAGYHGINNIEFRKMGDRSWRTSEIGVGYTTTCSKTPEWLTALMRDSEEVEPRQQIQFYEYGGGWLREFREKRKMFGAHEVSVYSTYRVHENGDCDSYIFQFAAEEGSEEFARFLVKKENEELSPDEKLRWMRSGNNLFRWNKFYIINPEYVIFNGGFDHQRVKFFREAKEAGAANPQSVVWAIEEYKKRVERRLRKLSDRAAQEARRRKSEEENFQKEDDFFRKRDMLRAAADEARYKVLDWSAVQKATLNFKKKIIVLAKAHEKGLITDADVKRR